MDPTQGRFVVMILVGFFIFCSFYKLQSQVNHKFYNPSLFTNYVIEVNSSSPVWPIVTNKNNMSDILQFLNDVFVTDPLILSSFLSPDDNHKLIKNKFITQDHLDRLKITINGKTKPVIQFGVLNSLQNETLLENFCSRMFQKLFFKCQDFKSKRFLGYHDLDQIHDKEDSITQFLIDAEDVFVGIQVFYNLDQHQDNVLWTARKNSTTDLNSPLNNLPVIEELYEPIKISFKNVILKLSANETQDAQIRLPGDIFGFLSQIASCQLVHCNIETAKILKSAKDQNLQIKALRSLLDMKKMSQEIRFPFSLSSGSLLGFFRECAGNSYTDDADYFTYDVPFANRQFEDQIRDYKYQDRYLNLKLIMIFGNYTHGYEMSFTSPSTGFKSDLFFMKHNLSFSNNQSYLSSHVIWKQEYYYYYYPLIDKLCSGLFLGHKVNLPCDPLKMIIPDYGTDWKTPVNQAKWNFATSGFNRGPAMLWDSKQHSQVTYL